MKSYMEFIEATRLIRDVTSSLTTGDVAYPGTAPEISDNGEEELFHVVVDSSGEIQVLLFAHDTNYRLPLSLLDRIVDAAKEKVGKKVD